MVANRLHRTPGWCILSRTGVLLCKDGFAYHGRFALRRSRSLLSTGFVMTPNELETYKEGPKAYEFKGTNGFMLTFDMTSKDLAAHKGSMSY